MSDTAPGDGAALTCGALRYRWHRQAFLTRQQATYALRRLWDLCGGELDTESGEVFPRETSIVLPAVKRDDVVRMHGLAAGELPWMDLERVLERPARLQLDTTSLPALCAPAAPLSIDGNACTFPLDLVTATFLLLTRWEEHAQSHREDQHGNFPAEASLAWRQGFLARPVLDEWALVLRHRLRETLSGWTPQRRAFRLFSTHDVDRPIKFKSLARVARGATRELVRRGSPRAALRTLSRGLRSLKDIEHDPFFRGFLDILDFNEQLQTRATFFLMTAAPGPRDDGYRLMEPRYRRLLELIETGGHDVGWHPGYRAAVDDAVFEREREAFEALVGKRRYGVRQHYLRWRPGHSWKRLDGTRAQFDSSLGWNDALGFRCGTSQPFPVYDLDEDRELDLVERPLIVQDVALLTETELDPSSAECRLREVLERVRTIGGELTFLIHPDEMQASLGIASFFLRVLAGEARVPPRHDAGVVS